MFKSKFVKRKLFFNWLISYLAVLLIAISIISIIYFRVDRTMKNEIDSANEAHLSRIQRAGDLRLNDMSNISLLVGIDRRVRSLSSIKTEFKAENQMDIIAVKDFLNTVKVSNGFIDQIYVYFKNTNTAIDNNSHLESRLAYRLFNGDKSMPYDDWLRVLNKRYNGTFINELTQNTEDEQDDTITYIRSIPISDTTDYTANIVIQFGRSKFGEILKGVATSEENSIFLLNNGEVVSSSRKEVKFDTKKYPVMDKKSGSFFTEFNGEEVKISYINSEIPGYKYVSITPKDIYFQKVTNTRNLVLLITFLFIVFGGFAAQYIVRRNYNPINNIIESISKNLGLPMENQKDELKFIQSVLNNTMDQNDKIVKKLKENEDVLRTSFLERLLKGRVDESKVTEDVLKEFKLSFDTNNFAVMLIVVNNYDLKNSLDEEMYEVKLLHFIITNVVEELINQSNKGMMVDLDNSTLACIINISDINKSNEQCKKEIVSAVEQAQAFIYEHFKISFSASLSNVYNNLGGVAFAYREALNAMNHKAFMGEDKIIFYDDVANLGNFYEYSAETEYKLMNVIKEGNFEDAKKIVNGVFESNFSNMSLTVETGECLVFDLLGTLIKIVDNNEVLDQLQPINRLRKCSTIQQMNEEIVSLLEYICDYFLQKNKNKSDYKLSMDVMDYIDKNYKNENLNVSMIGDYFNMTSNYLSRMFKTQVGEGLHNYIERIRIEKAKELIKSEKLNILEIAKEVGYTNSKTFIRVFKKIEGTTPGKFREFDDTK